MASQSNIKAGEAFVRLFLKDELTRVLTRTLRKVGQKFSRFGRSLRSFGKRLTITSLAVLAPLGYATKIFADFDDQMRLTKAVSGATGAEFQSLTDQAKELGRTTSFTASQVASGMAQLGRAGFAPGEIDQAIGGMLNLARATGTDLSEAADIAAASLRSFGLAAGEMDRVADVMTAAANNSAQTLTELGDSMKLAAPIANEYGLSLEDTAKAIGTLANFGIKGTMAGTGLRQGLLQLSDPSIRTKLSGLGVSLDDFGQTMLDIGRVSQEMSGPERLAFLKELFGRRAAGAGAKLGKEAFEKLSEAIDQAGGTAAKTAKEMDAGIGGTLRRLWSAIEGSVIAIGESLAPALENLATKLMDVGGWISRFVEKNPQVITQIASIAAGALAAGVAITGIGIAISGIGAVLGILSGISAALGMILTPIGLITAELALGAAAWFKWTKQGNDAASSIASHFIDLKDTVGNAIGGITDAFKSGDLELAAEIAFTTIELLWSETVGSMGDVLKGWYDDFKKMMIQINSWLQKNLDPMDALTPQERDDIIERVMKEGGNFAEGTRQAELEGKRRIERRSWKEQGEIDRGAAERQGKRLGLKDKLEELNLKAMGQHNKQRIDTLLSKMPGLQEEIDTTVADLVATLTPPGGTQGGGGLLGRIASKVPSIQSLAASGGGFLEQLKGGGKSLFEFTKRYQENTRKKPEEGMFARAMPELTSFSAQSVMASAFGGGTQERMAKDIHTIAETAKEQLKKAETWDDISAALSHLRHG